MKSNYEFPEIKIILFQEEVVRTSDPTYGNDSSDDWGYDIWD